MGRESVMVGEARRLIERRRRMDPSYDAWLTRRDTLNVVCLDHLSFGLDVALALAGRKAEAGRLTAACYLAEDSLLGRPSSPADARLVADMAFSWRLWRSGRDLLSPETTAPLCVVLAFALGAYVASLVRGTNGDADGAELAARLGAMALVFGFVPMLAGAAARLASRLRRLARNDLAAGATPWALLMRLPSARRDFEDACVAWWREASSIVPSEGRDAADAEAPDEDQETGD